MNGDVNRRAAWWAQSYGFPATLEGVQRAFRRHGAWTFMAFIARCVAIADRQGFRAAYDHDRFDRVVAGEAIAETLARFPA